MDVLKMEFSSNEQANIVQRIKIMVSNDVSFKDGYIKPFLVDFVYYFDFATLIEIINLIKVKGTNSLRMFKFALEIEKRCREYTQITKQQLLAYFAEIDVIKIMNDLGLKPEP